MKFFLRGVAAVSDEAAKKIEEIIELRERDRLVAHDRIGRPNAAELLNLFYRNPMLSVKTVSSTLGIAFATANSLLTAFVEAGILTETTGKKRNRIFAYPAYINLLNL